MNFKDVADCMREQHDLAIEGLMNNPKFLNIYEKFGLPIYGKNTPKTIDDYDLDLGQYPHFRAESDLRLLCGTLRIYSYTHQRTWGGFNGAGSFDVGIHAIMSYPDALGNWKYFRELYGGRVERHSRIQLNNPPSNDEIAEFKKKVPKTYNSVIARFLPVVEEYDMFSQSARLDHITNFRGILNITALMVIQQEAGEKTIGKALLPPFKNSKGVKHLDRLKTIMREWDEITRELGVGG